MNLKENLGIIRDKDPASYLRFVNQIQKDASQRITETGDMNALVDNWLSQLEFV
jgi:hypothetical protein